jgi:uncharacterized RDD family membrane protein YckC
MTAADRPPARGVRLGLPAGGQGSVAGTGRRLAAYVVDSVASALVAALFVADPADARRGILTLAVFVAQYLVLGSLTGQTLGMRALGVRMLHLPAPDRPPGLLAMAKRTALLALLVPAVVYDRDGRGLHDLVARTVVVRTR